MCTAATYKTRDFYFGRTLDYDHSYKEEVTVTPRNFPLEFRHGKAKTEHFAMIGMAFVPDEFPLYYDAVNEKGLCAAALNFVGNAHYRGIIPGRSNVAHFEVISRVLSECATVSDAKLLLRNINITDTPYSESLPTASLHWLIADRAEAITVEALREGLRIHENPIGILTNNPPFEEQLRRLSDRMALSPHPPKNNFFKALRLDEYSRGMGAIGLPGDLSSTSRFVRAAFVKANSVSGDSETESIGQFFHILGSVEQQRGCCVLEDGAYEITVYTSCCNADKGIYYYTTYGNRSITAVDMRREDLDGHSLARYPLLTEEQITLQNR